MSPAAWFAFVVAAGAAVIDWWAVAQRRRAVEYVAKPAVMVALIGAVLAIDAPSNAVRTWFVVALVFSLAGDVFLMLRSERFVAGLASFLVAHLAYVVGFLVSGVSGIAFAAGTAIGVAVFAGAGRVIWQGARARAASLAVPVGAYIAVISMMFAAAIGSEVLLWIAGAGLFYISDALLGWNRFVDRLPHGRLLVIVPYHLGQALLVTGLTVS